MQVQLKPLSHEAIPAALAKAERYRLLNEPSEAESICLDILRAEPEHQPALVLLLLALTDQFDLRHGPVWKEARDLLPRLRDPYERAYYEGLICERRAKALLKRGGQGAGDAACEWFQQAMTHYETAEPLRPPGNDDAILRWNTCARLLTRHRPVLAAGAGAAPAEPLMNE